MTKKKYYPALLAKKWKAKQWGDFNNLHVQYNIKDIKINYQDFFFFTPTLLLLLFVVTCQSGKVLLNRAGLTICAFRHISGTTTSFGTMQGPKTIKNSIKIAMYLNPYNMLLMVHL